MIELSFTVHTRAGQVTRYDLPVLTPAEEWAVDDAGDALWVIQRSGNRVIIRLPHPAMRCEEGVAHRSRPASQQMARSTESGPGQGSGSSANP